MTIIDPLYKLEILKKYMWQLIDNDFKYMSFNKHIILKHPQLIKDTPKYYKSISTNCFYCNKHMNQNIDANEDTATIDHFYPQSKTGGNDYSDILVICCKRCNGLKANMHPADFIRKMTIANMTGQIIKGVKQKSLERISESLNSIHNDVLLNRQKSVYYKSHDKSKLPKGLIEI